MERKYSDKVVGIIKELMAKNYKSSSICDILLNRYNIKVSSSDLTPIRKGEAYIDVRSELNQIIKNNYPILIDENKQSTIKEIKWALVEGFNEDEIIKTYKISKILLLKIKLGYSPYFNIAPEFNSALELKYKRKKKANINDRVVFQIKKEFVNCKGDIQLNQLADKYKIDSGSISNILNFKCYESVGSSYNERIQRIKKKMADKKISILDEKKKAKIKKERLKISELKQKNNVIASKIKNYESKIKELLAP